MASAVAVLFFTFHSMAMVLLPILALTFIVPCGPKRHATITNNLLIWAGYGLVASLLLLSGNIDTKIPPSTLCRAQSALVFGGSAARAAAAFALVLHLWHLAWSVNRPHPLSGRGNLLFDSVLVMTPWLTWIIVAVVTGMIGAKGVQRYSLYCLSGERRPATFAGAFTAFFLLFSCGFSAWVFILVSKRYRPSGRFGQNEIGHISLGLFTRIVVFSGLSFFCFILSILAIVTGGWTMDKPRVATVISTLGPITFLLFASQSDVLECWGLKRHNGHSTGSASPHRANDANIIYTINNNPTNPGKESNPWTIRIPLTFRALRNYASSSTQDGTDSKTGEHTTSYGMDVLRTLNKNPAPKQPDLIRPHVNGSSASTRPLALNPAHTDRPAYAGHGGSSTTLPSSNYDAVSIDITFNPPSIAEAPEDANSRSSNV